MPVAPILCQRLLFGHVLSSIAHADYVIRGGRWKLTQDHRRDEESLYDIMADPLQEANRIDQEPEIADELRRALASWRQQQLSYYHYPAYYLNYYPPPPPRWSELQTETLPIAQSAR